MAFPLKLVKAPTTEPVSLAEMKEHLVIAADNTADDALLGLLIAAARRMVEKVTGRAIMPQQWLFCLDYFPCYRVTDMAPARSDFDALGNYNFNAWRTNRSQIIALPKPPLASVDSIQYTDLSGALQPLDVSQYQVDDASEPARIMPAYGCMWPQTQSVMNAVQILYTAGYKDATLMPQTIPMAIKLAVGEWYQNRENVLAGATPNELPNGVTRLLALDKTQIFGYARQ